MDYYKLNNYLCHSIQELWPVLTVKFCNSTPETMLNTYKFCYNLAPVYIYSDHTVRANSCIGSCDKDTPPE